MAHVTRYVNLSRNSLCYVHVLELVWEEENRLPLQQRADDHRLAELWRARELAERAEPVCVCVCGKCRKGGVSPLASPLGSRSVATFNAKV